MLEWQGLPDAAASIRRKNSGAATVFGVANELDRLGVEYEIAYRAHGGAAFLEWVSRSHRLAAIHYGYGIGRRHAVTFAGFRGGDAIIIENSSPPKAWKIPKQEFIKNWRAGGGYGITALAPPPPLKPWR